MSKLESALQQRLDDRKNHGLLRQLMIPQQHLADFTSNDYLGLARSTELEDMINKKLDQIGGHVLVRNGSTGSRLLSGNNILTEEAEHLLAEIFHAEASLIFNSGYTANLAVFSSLPRRNDTIIYDEYAHACIKDGARLSLAKRLSFKHNDLNDLESKIRKSTGNIFVGVESVYSMDGDTCPLKELVEMKKHHNIFIILDEAHSTGLFGKGGAGLAADLGIANEITARIMTFGKAMGIHGACVVGSATLKSFLINFARPFIYTTALPNHSIVAMTESFAYLSSHPGLVVDLKKKIKHFRKQLSGYPGLTRSESPIQAVLFQGNDHARRIAMDLQHKGFDIRPILSPTVPEGLERVRICLHTFNTDVEILHLTQELKGLHTQQASDRT